MMMSPRASPNFKLPEITMPACQEWDSLVVETLEYIMESKLDQDSLDLMHLPRKKGGGGVCLHSRVAIHAYEASKSFAMNGGETPTLRQKARMDHDAAALEVDLRQRSKALNAHIARTKVKGSSKWMLAHNSTRPFGHEQFKAALRLRLRSPHIGLADVAMCKGCQKSWPAREWQEHVCGCTRVSGNNASSTHAYIKKRLDNSLQHMGIPFETAEPRDYQMLQCVCGERVGPGEWVSHEQACATAKHGPPRKTGPDRRIYLDTGPTVVDFTVVRPTCPSYVAGNKTAAAIMNTCAAEKRRLYKHAVEAQGEEFIVLGMYAHGGFPKETRNYVEQLVLSAGDECCYTETNILDDLRMGVEEAQGAALLNAERQLHVNRRAMAHGEVAHEAEENTQPDAKPAAFAQNRGDGDGTCAARAQSAGWCTMSHILFDVVATPFFVFSKAALRGIGCVLQFCVAPIVRRRRCGTTKH
jgi:hypothetical protein